MKLKKYKEYLVKESFGLSPQIWKFLDEKGIDWSEFTDSLMEISDLSNAEIKKYKHIIDEDNHIINVDLESDKQYRVHYTIDVNYNQNKSGKLENFNKFLEELNTITTAISEMIDRVKSLGLRVFSENYKIEDLDWSNSKQTIYKFQLEFVSEPINMVELKKYYDEYLSSTKFTPEFNDGLKKLVERYKRENINLMQFLDTATPDEFDTIMVGFITEDDIYGIADYNIKTKKFTMDEAEIEASIDWYRENYGFD